MSDEVHDSLIPYDEIVQDALRAVIGRVLRQIEKEGLPGDHHFYITFKTQALGVSIPAHLIQKYPDEMTIVLQNRFQDLAVDEEGFGIKLSFNQTLSSLRVPYAAISAFVDPSVDFGLQFQVSDSETDPQPHDEANNDIPVESDSKDGSNVVTVDFGAKH